MKAILAGNYEQYLGYCRFHNIQPNKNDLRYVHDVVSTLGLEFDSYEIIGTFWHRDDCLEIVDLMKVIVSRNSRTTAAIGNAPPRKRTAHSGGRWAQQKGNP